MLRAAIIGLGRIGAGFDEDPKRQGVWTHATAYLRASGVELVAGADPDLNACARFTARHHGASAYTDHVELLDRARPDIVSICTPTGRHADLVLAACAAGVRAVFCEKPIADTLDAAQRIVDACRGRGTVLAVNHTRRWDREWLWPRRLIADGAIGRVRSVTASYSGGVLNMGTHLLDTMSMLIDRSPQAAWGAFVCSGREDPAVEGVLEFPDGVRAMVACGQAASDLLFEIEVTGSDGRLRIADNGQRLERYVFGESRRYSGYRELQPVDAANPLPEADRFVAAIEDLVACVSAGAQPACTGEDGARALGAALALRRSAERGGLREPVPPIGRGRE